MKARNRLTQPVIILAVLAAFLYQTLVPEIAVTREIADTAESTDHEYHAAKVELARFYRRLATARAALPEAEFKPSARAALIGADDAAAYRYVRDDVTYEPYHGVLRHAEGALMSHAGNAFDQALLLAEILRTQGYTARFARATLAPDLARRLLSITNQPPAQSRNIPLLSKVTGLASDGAIGIFADELTAAARDHAWVQIKRGDAWIDLDPAVPWLTAGQRLATPSWTGERLVDDRYYRIRGEIGVENMRAEAREATTVLAFDLTLTRAVNDIAISFIQAPSDDDPTFVGPTDVLRPLIKFNGRQITGQPFDISGRPVDAVENAEEEFFAAPRNVVARPKLTNVTLRMSLIGPQGEVGEIERTIAARDPDLPDQASAEADIRRQLSARLSMAASGSRIVPSLLSTLFIDALVENRDYMSMLLAAAYGAPLPSSELFAEGGSATYPFEATALLRRRVNLIDEHVAKHHPGVSAYPGIPQIAALRQIPMRGDETMFAASFDIMVNRIMAFRPDATAGTPPKVALDQDVIDGPAENPMLSAVDTASPREQGVLVSAMTTVCASMRASGQDGYWNCVMWSAVLAGAYIEPITGLSFRLTLGADQDTAGAETTGEGAPEDKPNEPSEPEFEQALDREKTAPRLAAQTAPDPVLEDLKMPESAGEPGRTNDLIDPGFRRALTDNGHDPIDPAFKSASNITQPGPIPAIDTHPRSDAVNEGSELQELARNPYESGDQIDPGFMRALDQLPSIEFEIALENEPDGDDKIEDLETASRLQALGEASEATNEETSLTLLTPDAPLDETPLAAETPLKEEPAEIAPEVAEARLRLVRIDTLLVDAVALRAAKKLTTPSGASAADRYRQVLQLDPDNEIALAGLDDIARTYRVWGRVNLTQGRNGRAAVYFGRALSIDERDIAALALFALAKQRAGESDAAESAYQKALLLTPEDEMLQAQLGYVLYQQGRFSEAAEALNNALINGATDAAVPFYRGLSLGQLGDWEGAEVALSRGLTLSPSDARLHRELGYSLFRLGRHADAVKSLEAATRRAPDDAFAYLYLSLAQRALGENENAKISIKRHQALLREGLAP